MSVGWTGKKATCKGSTETVHDIYNKATYAANLYDSDSTTASTGIFGCIKSMNDFRIKTGDSSFLNPIQSEVEARNTVLLKQEEVRDNYRLNRDRELIAQQMSQSMGQRIKDRALAAMARGDLQGGQFSNTTGKQSNKTDRAEEKIYVRNRVGEKVQLEYNEKQDEYGDIRMMNKQERDARDAEEKENERRQLLYTDRLEHADILSPNYFIGYHTQFG